MDANYFFVGGRGVGDRGRSPLRYDFDVDFNVLTAFIRLGRARPAGAGCPPYYYLTFFGAEDIFIVS